MYLQSSIMSQISRKNSFRKVVFPFMVGNFMSRDGNWFFGRHFVIVYPIFDFFAVFWFFWITLSVACISPPNSFRKVLFWVRVHRDPLLTTNGSALYLEHLSVTGKLPSKPKLSMFCVLSENQQHFFFFFFGKITYIGILKKIVWETKKLHLNFNRPNGSWVILRGVEWVHGLFLFPLVLGKM